MPDEIDKSIPEDLGDATLVTFGKYSGKRIDCIPSSYLRFIARKFGKDNERSIAWTKIALDSLERRGENDSEYEFTSRTLSMFAAVACDFCITPSGRKHQHCTTIAGAGGMLNLMQELFKLALKSGLLVKFPDNIYRYAAIHHGMHWEYNIYETSVGSPVYEIINVNMSDQGSNELRTTLRQMRRKDLKQVFTIMEKRQKHWMRTASLLAKRL